MYFYLKFLVKLQNVGLKDFFKIVYFQSNICPITYIYLKVPSRTTKVFNYCISLERFIFHI